MMNFYLMGKLCERNIKTRRKLISFLLNKKRRESLGLRVLDKKKFEGR